jgi:hypothetical protein
VGLSDVSLVATGTAFSDSYETQWCNDAGDVTYQQRHSVDYPIYPFVDTDYNDYLDWMPFAKRGSLVEVLFSASSDSMSMWYDPYPLYPVTTASAIRISNSGAVSLAWNHPVFQQVGYHTTTDGSTRPRYYTSDFGLPSGGGFTTLSLNDLDEAVYIYEYSGPDGDRTYVALVEWLNVARSILLQTGDPAPGNTQWNQIQGVSLNNSGQMAFTATRADGSAGVYVAPISGGAPVSPESVTVLATTGQLAPDSGDAYFAAFGAAAINSNGDVAFRADLNNGESGIYIASDNDLSFTAYCPVDIIITAPDGSVCSRDINQIPRARYLEGDFNDDGEPTADKRVVIVGPRAGEYTINIMPQADTGEYSLLVEQGELGSVLLRDDATVAAERIGHFLPDDVPPVSRHRLAGLAGNPGWLISPVQVALSAVDPAPGSGVAAIHYALDNQAKAVYEDPFTVSVDGVHSLSFQATDGAGNTEEPVVVTMAIDQTAPEVSVVPEIQQVWPDEDGVATAEVTAIATDNVCPDLSYAWLAQGDTPGKSPHLELTFDAAGIYTIDLVVTDDAGHETADQATVVVGPTMPADLEMEPHTLSWRGSSWVTAYVLLPTELARCEDVIASTVRLNGTVSPAPDLGRGSARNEEPCCIDRNGDGITERMLKFERSEVLGTLPRLGGSVTLTGHLSTGSDFVGTDSVKVVDGYYGSQADPMLKPVTDPATYYLATAHPNPFNAETHIAFGLAEAQRAQLVVCDVLGRTVRAIVDADLPAGQHEARWDGMDDSGRGVATGVYFCRLQAGSFRALQRMLLVR